MSVSPAPARVTPRPEAVRLPDHAALSALFGLKYGDPAETGWAPRLRRRFDYYTPDDVYEALLDSLVTEQTCWLDVGCGRDLFPSNHPLAAILAERCARLVGVDPAPTLQENPFVHERVQGTIDDYPGGEDFDLVTMRMVAEHVDDPAAVVASLRRCVRPGGRVVVYTVNRFSPVPLLTALVPFWLHQPVKRVLWRTEKRDTFPTRFRMNTRRSLAAVFAGGGFDEELFAELDDCRTFGRFRLLQWGELLARTGLRKLRLGYPERCLLGVYRRAPVA